MLMMHVTLLFRHKSSFSYLPPLLTCSAIISRHTLFSLSLALPPAAKHREKLPISVWPESSCFSVFSGARCCGKHFLGTRKGTWVPFLGTEVLQFLLPLGKPFGEWFYESPTDAALQLADHISPSLKNTSVHLTPPPQPMSKEGSEFQWLENRS